MCPLRRVEDHQASPAALGILVPPGRRTFLILRPRSLSWDLLLWSHDTSGFRGLRRDEADAIALEMYHALAAWSEGGGGRVEDVACPDGRGFWLRVSVGAFALLVCGRQPGCPYQPHVFADAETALTAAAQLRSVLCPSAGVNQEVYLNTRHFTR